MGYNARTLKQQSAVNRTHVGTPVSAARGAKQRFARMYLKARRLL
jgi:hypothetical protein